MKKIGIIADIHANLDALEATLDAMPKVDKIICAGDLVGYGPQPNEVIDVVRRENILSVKGNIDHAVVNKNVEPFEKESAKAIKWTWQELENKNVKFLKNLRKKEKIEEEGYEIFIAHGTPRNPFKESIFPGTSNRALAKMTQGTDVDFIVLGHTHVPLKQMIQGRLILNPGSVGQPRDRNSDSSYTVLNLNDENEVLHERVPYDIEVTEQKIKDAGLPEKLAIRLHLGW